MVIISEIFSITDVVVRATILLSRISDKWYKRGPEIETFESSLSILSHSLAQWESQLKKGGIDKEDPVYSNFLAQAVQLLDAEKDYYEKHRTSWLWKLKRRPFPSQLTYILSNILKLVQEGPELLAKSVERQELLTQRFLADPSPLPFCSDPKYVPLQGTVRKVQRALDDTEGQQVVTLYGAPGIGKSSLAKYVALLYQDLIQASTSCSFDGVQYLFCGQGCGKNVHQLCKGFFSSLGFGKVFSDLKSDAITEQAEGRDHNLSSCLSALRDLLAERKLLTILDDIWEEDFEVLTDFISSGTPCKYLLTSQSRNVWQGAKTIRMPSPTDEEALNVFTNHLQGFLSTEQDPFPAADVEGEIRKVIRKLDNHPLSLVNVAVSMNQNGIVYSNYWKSLAENIFGFLDDNYNSHRILVYERPYSHSVSASMMLMVESLSGAERDVLFLIALLQNMWGSRIPEHLVRFFIRRFYRDNPSQSTSKYFDALQCLENKSLVQVDRFQRGGTSLVDSVGTNRMSLTIHKLRREYIIQKRLSSLRIIVSSLVASSGGDRLDRTLLNVRDSDQCLAVVLGAMCFDDVLIDEVALPFQSVMTQMNRDGVPIGPEQEVVSRAERGAVVPLGPQQQLGDVCQRVKAAKHRYLYEYWDIVMAIGVMMELLNLEGDERWKQQVHSDARKIIMELVCKKQLDDASMASLFTIPYTTEAACQIFAYIYQGMYGENLEHVFNYRQRKSLSDALPATWQVLSSLGSTTVPADYYLMETNW